MAGVFDVSAVVVWRPATVFPPQIVGTPRTRFGFAHCRDAAGISSKRSVAELYESPGRFPLYLGQDTLGVSTRSADTDSALSVPDDISCPYRAGHCSDIMVYVHIAGTAGAGHVFHRPRTDVACICHHGLNLDILLDLGGVQVRKVVIKDYLLEGDPPAKWFKIQRVKVGDNFACPIAGLNLCAKIVCEVDETRNNMLVFTRRRRPVLVPKHHALNARAAMTCAGAFGRTGCCRRSGWSRTRFTIGLVGEQGLVHVVSDGINIRSLTLEVARGQRVRLVNRLVNVDANDNRILFLIMIYKGLLHRLAIVVTIAVVVATHVCLTFQIRPQRPAMFLRLLECWVDALRGPRKNAPLALVLLVCCLWQQFPRTFRQRTSHLWWRDTANRGDMIGNTGL
ncbi:hypothetical protein FJTKL_12437 [Diaporthe vaccinii]|uniref:Uncharacterized protein n=1 Tax=Diaporthe vaccinii TaxID=105482 RepID=A0ABR4EDW1_9PEZI